MKSYEDFFDQSADEETVEQKEVPSMEKDSGSTEELVNDGQRCAVSEDITDDVSQGNETKSEAKSTKPKGKKAKEVKKSAKASSESSTMNEVPIHCVTCNCTFPSRNKLFEHLKATGHARATTPPTINGPVNAKIKKEKRKNR
ncbi:dnaJ homolog subfamily C member 21 [Hirundo rustica]|nr:dnaJ homolog subfamily C member 21 [Hirundo rustica]